MKDEGKQYPKDDVYDKTGFRRKARLHQSKYRAEILQVEYDKHGNYLTAKDAKQGFNFYNDFSIFAEVKSLRPNYSKALYANMLRSEHIPFNFFIPLKFDLYFARDCLNAFFGNTISEIDKFEIEYAPSPQEDYLNDKTSFDVYIEFTHVDGNKGILGIEVKYTEHEYKLKKGSKEELDIQDKNSAYNRLTNNIHLYKKEFLHKLPKDRYRQVWRNQLLGESMLSNNNNSSSFKHFISIVLFPNGNEHFREAAKEYAAFLHPDCRHKFRGITFEEFIDVARGMTTDKKYLKWLDYLSERYIIE